MERMGQSGKTLFHKTIGGFIWVGVGTGGQAFAHFLVLVILARLLTPSDFGIVTAALVIVLLSTFFVKLGIGPALIHIRNLSPNHVRSGFTISLLMGIFFYIVVFLLAGRVESFFGMPGLAGVLKFLSLVFILKGLGVVSEALLQREMDFKFISITMLLSFLFGYATIGIGFAYAGFGPYSLVAAYVGQAAIQSIVQMAKIRHSVIPLLDLEVTRELMYYGVGQSLAGLGNYLGLQGDNVVVGRFFDAVLLGVYSRAYQIITLPVHLFGTVMDKVLFPVMASIQSEGERLADAYRRGLVATSLLMVPSSIFIVAFAREIVLIILGDQWGDAVVPLQVLAVGLIFRAGYKISDSLARATGAVYRRAWRQWVYGGAIVLFSIAFHPWGVGGVAGGVTLAVFINYILMATLGMKISGLTWKNFLLCHSSAFSHGVIWVSGSVTITHLVGETALPLVYVSISLISLVSISVFLSILLPRIFLGTDGEWFLVRLIKLLKTSSRVM
jgi:O-antigen/teichoic acid export membrane protein